MATADQGEPIEIELRDIPKSLMDTVQEGFHMPAPSTRKQLPIFVGLGALLLVSACAGNQYEAPEGQQHYIDNQNYQQITIDRLP